MGIFNRSNAPGYKSTQTTIIAQTARIEGTFKLECDLHIDGYIEGKIDTEHTVTIGQTGRFKGFINADTVIISGLVEGKCIAHSVDILENGQVKGNVETSELSIAKGGHLTGEIKEPEDVNNVALISRKPATVTASPETE